MTSDDRMRFREIADDIYEDARENDPDQVIDEDDRRFLIDYGKALGREYASVMADASQGNPDAMAFTAAQTESYLEYMKLIVSLYELGGADIPEVARLVANLDEAFCHPSSTEI